MAHVDVLSRQVYFAEMIPVERELEFRQLQDARLKEIAMSLEFCESSKYKGFQLIGLVYKKENKKTFFAVPDTMVNNLIHKYHDEMAHCGVEKAYQGMWETYWFPSMRKHVRDYIENCIVCLMADGSTHKSEGEL